MVCVVLLLGGNIGDTEWIIRSAHSKIEEKVGKVVNTSSLYTSEPWGFDAEQWFINQVLIVNTELNAEQVLQHTQEIERELGRVRMKEPTTFQSRSIDIDILFYDNHVINTPDLKVPHPMLHLRRFTLLPLVELIPDFVHPSFDISVEELLDSCPDQGAVKKLE
ncbi:MAG: 2-amino-4-hydroxy-6-hydroxymethyldihydropteridine diphosphokinase [Bacteroidales bacterium]